MSLLDKASLIVTPNAYKASKLYSVVPSSGAGDMNVVRATTATRKNSLGLIESVAVNAPRIDYTNGSCPSLLVEPQRTNINTYSQDLTNAAYTTAAGVGGSVTRTANYGISPDGTQNATRLQIVRGTTFAEFFQRSIVTLGATYTLSFWAKSLSGTPTLYTAYNNGYANEVTFTNQWVRYTYTFVAGSFLTSGLNLISWSSLPTTSTSADLLVWGVQLEAGSYPTSYIPTVASVTRNADIISKTGISSLIGQTEGTLFCDVNLNSRVSFSYLALSTDLTTSSNYLGIAFLANAIAFESVVGAALQANISYSNSSTGRFKIAAAYKANDFVLYINGTQIGTDTSGTIPACSQLGLNAFATAQALNYNSVQLYKTKLSNTELAQLTTL